MRQPRLTLEPEACAFHCLARTIDQNWYFDTPKRRDQIVRIIQASEILYGANLLNFVVMSNHIHLLAQMRTESSREPLTKSTLLKVSRVLYSRAYVTDLKQEFKRAEKIDRQTGDKWHTQNILNRYEKRRGCLSTFMKGVKERIAHYTNKQHNRKGTVWDGRFKSPIVQNSLESLLAVSAYIDLNPIRAGIEDKPEDYRWCGYAAALAGNKLAQKGLAQVFAYRGKRTKPPKWNQIKGDYRQILFEKGLEMLADPESGIKGRLGFTAEEVEQEIQRNGKLPQGEVLLHRVRYFTDGAIIGTASFVDEVFQANREKLTSPTSRRSTGARTMRGAEWGDLTCLRDLRKNVIGHPD